MLIAIYTWVSGNFVQGVDSNPDFARFSSSYTALMLFVVCVALCSKQDLGIFMRIGSYGIIFVLVLVVFVISMGIIALGNTEFTKGNML
jgi:ABC-type Na+ efflux pump permease subunit